MTLQEVQTVVRMNERLNSIALDEDEYSQALIGYLIERKYLEPEIFQLELDPEGNIHAKLTDGRELVYGTLESMKMWLERMARLANLDSEMKTHLFRIASEKVAIDPEYIRRQSHALPAPKTTTEGAPIDPETGRPVQSIQDLLGDWTLDEVLESEGYGGDLYYMFDAIFGYPMDYSFEKSRYQHGQFEVHDFVDYRGDTRFDFIKILKHAAPAPGEPEPEALLLCGDPGDKSENEVSHVLRSDQDEFGNRYVWYYNLTLAAWADNFEETYFDEVYIASLQSMVPDKSLWPKIILEYDLLYVDPEHYDEGGIGWLGIMAWVHTLDNSAAYLRPGPEMVLRDPEEDRILAQEVIESVCRFNGMEIDSKVTQYSPGLMFYSPNGDLFDGRRHGRPNPGRAKRNLLKTTRPKKRSKMGSWASQVPRGYEPVAIEHHEPQHLTSVPIEGLEGFGLVLATSHKPWAGDEVVGYDVINKHTGEPLNRDSFRDLQKAAEWADKILVKYLGFFQQSADEQWYDERYRDVLVGKAFPKVASKDLWIPPKMESIRGFHSPFEGQALAQHFGDDGFMAKVAKYAEKALKEKLGRDWRKKVNIRFVPAKPIQKAEATEPERYIVQLHGYKYRGHDVFVRKQKGKRREIVALRGGKYYKVPDDVVQNWREMTGGKIDQDIMDTVLMGGARGTKAEERLKSWEDYRKRVATARKLIANPGAEFYVYPMSGQVFGPFRGKRALEAAEAAAVLYIMMRPQERWAEIRQRTPRGVDEPVAYLDLGDRPVRGKHFRVHN